MVAHPRSIEDQVSKAPVVLSSFMLQVAPWEAQISGRPLEALDFDPNAFTGNGQELVIWASGDLITSLKLARNGSEQPLAPKTKLSVITQGCSLLSRSVEILECGELQKDLFDKKVVEGAKKDIFSRMSLDSRIHAGASKAAERKYGGQPGSGADDDDWDD